MCGICGWAGTNVQATFATSTLRSMAARLAHRGPDGDGIFCEPGIALAHRRLAILDPAHGQQPLQSNSGRYVISYNGEIYNSPVLRRQLARKGYEFRTHCDTEVIVALAEFRGYNFLDDLEGMFAFALWDREECRLLLARDGVGIKPLIYRIDTDGIRFASEIKALREEKNLAWNIDPQALHHYFGMNAIPAPFTVWRECRKLEPGEQLIWSAGNVRQFTYWSPPDCSVVSRCDIEKRAGAVRKAVSSAVRSQLLSDVPIGVFLSAGMDSAIVLRSVAEARSSGIGAYCLGLQERSWDERPGARETARLMRTQLHECLVESDLSTLVPKLAVHFDEPFADSSALPVWELCRQARSHITVALSGEGGDEVFGGYETYRAHVIANLFQRILPGTTFKLARLFTENLAASDRKGSMNYRAQRFFRDIDAPDAERHFLWKAIQTESMKYKLYSNAWGTENGGLEPTVELWRRAFHRYRRQQPVTRAMLADMSIYMANDLLPKVDMASMAHSLEVRVPLLDRRLIELVSPLPDSLKVGPLRRKKLLWSAFPEHSMQRIFHRPKGGFSIPVASWLRDQLRPLLLDAISSSAFRQSDILRRDQVLKLYKRHLDRREDMSRTLWGILMFALWLEEA